MKFNQGVIAASLTLCLLAAGTTAFAANTDSTAPAASQAQEASAAQARSDSAAAAVTVKLTQDEAVAAAEAANSGYKFTVEELDKESGTSVYELNGTDGSGAQKKVLVNALDGTVSAEADGSDNTEQDRADEQDSENEQDQSALAAQAKITDAQAIAAAEAASSGYTFAVDKLEDEDGSIVYQLDGSSADGSKLEASVNAIDGSVTTEADDD